MLKKRIIPCLDIQDGRTVKGVRFVEMKDAGDPVALARRYVQEGADELVFLDISATVEKRKTLQSLVEQIAKHINIPFTVGGGVADLDDARALVRAGADKISINSAAVKNPDLIEKIAGTLGSQCLVLAIDAGMQDGRWRVFVNGGRTPTGIPALEWAQRAEALGAGELLLTSMDHDGTRQGFALDLLAQICPAVRIPVIASGGAGQPEHFKTLFQESGASAALAAGIFHFGQVSIPDLKQYLKKQRVPVR